MGRKYESSQRFAVPVADLWSSVPDVLDEAGFEILEVDDSTHTIRGKKRKDAISTAEVHIGVGRSTAPAAKTFGERLHLTLTETASGCEVWVESRLRFGLVDWGENRKNVERVLAGLRQHT